MIPTPRKQHEKHAGYELGCHLGLLISLGWLHRKVFLLVPKLQCEDWNGENGVWRIHIRSRHVPWHDSELPMGMTLLFILLNRIIFFVFWPVLCLFLYYGRAWYKKKKNSPTAFLFLVLLFKKNSSSLWNNKQALCLCNAEFTGLKGIILLYVNWAPGLILSDSKPTGMGILFVHDTTDTMWLMWVIVKQADVVFVGRSCWLWDTVHGV